MFIDDDKNADWIKVVGRRRERKERMSLISEEVIQQIAPDGPAHELTVAMGTANEDGTYTLSDSHWPIVDVQQVGGTVVLVVPAGPEDL